MVHGSGPQNLDSAVGPNTPFRDIAEGLAARGVAVLRYNKRYYQYPHAIGQVTVEAEVIDDGIAAVVLLKDNTRIQSKNIFIVGHSLGAQLAPEIALRSQQVSGLVLLAPPGRTPHQYIVEQLRYVGSSADNIAKIEQDFQKLESGHVEGLKILGAEASYWQQLYAYQGIDAARKLAKPILVLRGDRDYQVSDKDIQIWRKGLNGSLGFVAKTLPDLNHLFMRGEGKPGPHEYRIAGTVDPIVFDEIVSFIREQVPLTVKKL